MPFRRPQFHQRKSNQPDDMQASDHTPEQKLSDSIAADPRPGTLGAQKDRSVKRVLLAGVFWRILIIELILLVGSLLTRAFLEQAGGWELFWYAVRIILLVAVIILFMWLTLSAFLKNRIIEPLEAISRANRQLKENDPAGRRVDLPPAAPREIKDIAASRAGMVSTILRIADERLRLVDLIKKTFGRYLSDKVVDEILSSPEGASLGGRRQEVTVLMSDLRGFTTMSAERDPEELVALLNRYLSRMSEVIFAYDGVIDEFIGDAILAVFGVPEPRTDDAARAVACALDMQLALAELNQEMEEPLEMGIALNTGLVLVGNIGSERRLKYGVVGSPVNLAARLESVTVGGQVVIGQSTYEIVNNLVTTAPAQTTMMKGFSQPLISHSVLAIGAPFNLRLAGSSQGVELTPLELPFTAWLVTGKKVSEKGLSGSSLAMGEGILEVRLPEKLHQGNNLKLNIDLCAEAHCFEDMYAKVVEVKPGDEGHVHVLRITAISAQDRTLLARWLEQAS
jgi:adenylate cyclase